MRLGSLVLATLFPAITCLLGAPVLTHATDEMGKLRIQAVPKQAYVFIDGKAIRDGDQTIELPAAKHQVGVYNYEYLPQTKDVQITAGQKNDLRVVLQASGEMVSRPFADIECYGMARRRRILSATSASLIGIELESRSLHKSSRN